jgi:hypothetical protein
MRGTMRRAPAVDAEAIAAAIPPYRVPARRGWAMGWRAAAAVVALLVGGTSIALLTGRAPGAGEDVTQYVRSVPESRRDAETLVVPSPSNVPAPAIEAPRSQPATAVANRELAMAGPSISDLSDRELSALVEGIESLDAVPSTEVDGEEPVSLGRQEDS